MRRFVGAVLIGLGALLVVFAVGLPVYVAPAVSKIPYDLQPCDKDPAKAVDGCLKPSVVEATGAVYLHISSAGLKIETGTLHATTEVVPQVKLTTEEQKANRLGDAVVWDVYQTVQDSAGAVISASSTELALDRASGAAVSSWEGQWIDDSGTKDTTIRYSEQVYKFPFGTEKRDYKIYDSDVRAASTAKFVAVEDIDGVEVYHFRQVIGDTELPVDATSKAALIATFSPTAPDIALYYRNTREVWVDPVTGTYLKVREQQHKEIRPTDGSTTTVLLEADFVSVAASIAESVKSAKANGSQLKIVTLYGPILGGILGVLLLAVGFLLSRRSSRPPTPGAWDAALPKPRGSLREGAHTA